MTPSASSLVLATLLAAAATASAADQATIPATTATATATATAPAEVQALRAVRDKETGRLRAATAQELAEMDAAARAARVARGLPADEPTRPLVMRQHANGMRSVVLGPEHLVTLRGHRLPDGRLVHTHDDPAHAHPTKLQPAATE